jgi:hypothetical protein
MQLDSDVMVTMLTLLYFNSRWLNGRTRTPTMIELILDEDQKLSGRQDGDR